MIALLVALAGAADGDRLGPVTLWEPIDPSSMECREDACQVRASAYGVAGTLAVKTCGERHRVISATLSASFVADSASNRELFGSYMSFLADPRRAAIEQARIAHDAHTRDGWRDETVEERGGLPWIRVVQPPHAHLIRTTRRTVDGRDVWTTSVVAAATSLECPRPE